MRVKPTTSKQATTVTIVLNLIGLNLPPQLKCNLNWFTEMDFLTKSPQSEPQNAVKEQPTTREALRPAGIAVESERPDLQGFQVPGQEQADQEGGGRHHEEGLRHLGEGDGFEIHPKEQREGAHRDQIRAALPRRRRSL